MGEVPSGCPAEVTIGDSLVMIGPIVERKPFPAFLYVYVDNTDQAYRSAVEAGAETVEEPLDTLARPPAGN